jgi:low affinity Fe/Cu permease
MGVPLHDPERSRSNTSEAFRRLAGWYSAKLGTHWAFLAALLLVIGWAATGPFFGFSEKWPLIINTATTILTFLMVFLIQSTQNRDAKAIHLKLDELIRAGKARNVFAALEFASEEELAGAHRRLLDGDEPAERQLRRVGPGAHLCVHRAGRRPVPDRHAGLGHRHRPLRARPDLCRRRAGLQR